MSAIDSLPTYFLSHGGGPWPWMKEEYGRLNDTLEFSLRDITRQLGGRPKAALVVSAHWEAPVFTLQAKDSPGMLYDYSGFPDYTYHVSYPAPGSPSLAARTRELLEGAGIRAALDEDRGFDHGTFAPLAVVFPEADVPIVQLSLRRGLDASEHLALGRALKPLRREGILILGSGLSYHNLAAFGPAAKDASQQFDAWLRESLLDLPAVERGARLLEWEGAPSARKAHPREEHLLPLMVALGAADGEEACLAYHEEAFMGGVTVSSFRFGSAAKPPAPACFSS